jgi:Ca2+-binding RTX toxin-like protein
VAVPDRSTVFPLHPWDFESEYEGIPWTGTGDADIFEAEEGNSVLFGLGGNDILLGSGGTDRIYGGSGDDTLSGASESGAPDLQGDFLSGEGGNDRLIGQGGNDLLWGDWGNDVLIGGFGDDQLEGGLSEDQLEGGEGDDWLLGGQNNDLLQGEEGNDTLQGNEGDDILLGGAGQDALAGTAGDDQLWGGEGDDRLEGGEGIDVLDGGTGNDTYMLRDADDTIIDGGGIDTILAELDFSLAGLEIENLTLTLWLAIQATGNALDNHLTGNDRNNTLLGLEGDDVLDGGAGSDVMVGGTGDDTYVVEYSGDQMIELADEGIDTVRSSIAFSLVGTALENLVLVGTDAIDGTGNAVANELTGNDADNRLAGLEGDDTLDGSAGNDVLEGGQGRDILRGGDQVDVLLGGDGDDLLQGGAGDDRLEGGAGDDLMEGGLGNDTYVLADAGDRVDDAGGNDSIRSGVSYSLAGIFIENLALTGDAVEARGNSLSNRLTGNAGANALIGLGGNDVLDGSTGADVMTGGTGDDIYVVDQSGDRIVELADQGIDTVRSRIAFSLEGTALEHLELTGYDAIRGTGNAANNIITGNRAANTLRGLGGNDILDGGFGKDLLEGGTGDDTYYVTLGDRVIEASGAGTDTVIADASFSLAGQFIENLQLLASATIGTGNSLNNVITATTGWYGSMLYGMGGKDRLNSTDGNDLLDGGSGADVMIGGAGNDTYYVDDLGDRVEEQANRGLDEVFSSVSFSLKGQFIDRLTLTGTADLSGTGNNQGNLITGNAGSNLLNGGAGDDRIWGDGERDTLEFGDDVLIGGLGRDELRGGGGLDIYRYLAPEEGGDVIRHQGGQDVIEISAAGFGHGLEADMDLLATEFYAVDVATADHAQLLWLSARNALVFDADGRGAQAAVLLAELTLEGGWSAEDLRIIA